MLYLFMVLGLTTTTKKKACYLYHISLLNIFPFFLLIRMAQEMTDSVFLCINKNDQLASFTKKDALKMGLIHE